MCPHLVAVQEEEEEEEEEEERRRRRIRRRRIIDRQEVTEGGSGVAAGKQVRVEGGAEGLREGAGAGHGTGEGWGECSLSAGDDATTLPLMREYSSLFVASDIHLFRVHL